MLPTEIHNPTASATPARDLDTTPQFAERKSSASFVVVNTILAYTSALPAKQLESPAPTQSSSVPTARDHTKPTPQPAKPSLTSTKPPKKTKPPPPKRPSPPHINQLNVCTTFSTRHPPDDFPFSCTPFHSLYSTQHSKIEQRYANTPPPGTQINRHHPNPRTLG